MGITPIIVITQKQPFVDVLQNRCSQKFCKFHSKTSVLEPEEPATLSKETPTQMFSSEIFENFKNTIFTEHL